MKISLIEADSRAHVNPDWLSSFYTYSFGRYYDPTRMGFGPLRVLNDDVIDPGKGFDYHRHDNMEIVTIVMDGGLKHRDSMGNESVIKPGEVQAMSAGSGIFHSEENASDEESVSLIQIWVETAKQGIDPKYSQMEFDFLKDESGFGLVVAPEWSDEEVVKIHQEAWFSYGFLKAGENLKYKLKKKDHGVFVMVLEGEISLGDLDLGRRDAVEISEIDNLEFNIGEKGAKVLIIEVSLMFY